MGVPNSSITPSSEVYYDVETQLSAEEVGGWNNVHLMRVSIAVTYSAVDGFKRWNEQGIPSMLDYLDRFERIVSFNGDGFDSRVLSYYGNVLPMSMKSFDVLKDLTRKLGHRVKLDSVAQATLGIGKSADGLAALRWWKEGKVDTIAEYCQQDVQVLVDVVAHGRENHSVNYTDRSGLIRSVNVQW
jgi:DEAD/DEAH box helicase domain-containing protein